MDIFFKDPNEIPLPPEEVRLQELKAEPWADGKRVRVYLEVDPFQKRPSANLVIFNANGDEVASANILETMARKMELNMHLREDKPGGEYSLEAVLYYQKLPEVKEETPPEEPPEPLIVDQVKINFTIPIKG